MANTLTDLTGDIYLALDKVGREMVGFIPAVARNSGAERVAIGDSVVVPITRVSAPANTVPGQNPPDAGDQTVDNVKIGITKSQHVAIRWNGEQQLAASNSGLYQSIFGDQLEQAFRVLANTIEGDLASTYVSASRAYGTAGTTPFGTAADLSDFAGIVQILNDNGAASDDRHLVLGSNAMFNIRGKQSGLFRINEAGTDQLLRLGTVGTVQGLAVHESMQVKSHTKGTGSSYLVNNGSGYAIGDSGIAVDTGSGTVLAGDILSFAGDTNKYVSAAALSAGNLSLAAPGLRKALADNAALTVGNNYTANMAFHRNAIVLAARAPASQGDKATQEMMVTDPISNLTFRIAVYSEYMQAHTQVQIAWGWKVVKPEQCVILLG